MARVLSGTGAGTRADWDNGTAMRRFLDEAWEAFRNGGVPPVKGDITRFSRRSLSHEMALLLDSVRTQLTDND